MNKEEIFTKEQIDYVKHCGEHFEVLTGGRGHSKTKEIIEKLEQENQQLKEENDYLIASDLEKMGTIKHLKDRIDKAIEFIKEHNKNAGSLFYKYNNKYLLSEIKEDLLEILKVENDE